ncbi:MAG TPA: hypothetical protein VMV69_24670, partial [Pirellulales bacterium]|nr:hypothetical protein [Pirellulales bacterium]
YPTARRASWTLATRRDTAQIIVRSGSHRRRAAHEIRPKFAARLAERRPDLPEWLTILLKESLTLGTCLILFFACFKYLANSHEAHLTSKDAEIERLGSP